MRLLTKKRNPCVAATYGDVLAVQFGNPGGVGEGNHAPEFAVRVDAKAVRFDGADNLFFKVVPQNHARAVEQGQVAISGLVAQALVEKPHSVLTEHKGLARDAELDGSALCARGRRGLKDRGSI